jgi:hypothetical protein
MEWKSLTRHLPGRKASPWAWQQKRSSFEARRFRLELELPGIVANDAYFAVSKPISETSAPFDEPINTAIFGLVRQGRHTGTIKDLAEARQAARIATIAQMFHEMEDCEHGVRLAAAEGGL